MLCNARQVRTEISLNEDEKYPERHRPWFSEWSSKHHVSALVPLGPRKGRWHRGPLKMMFLVSVPHEVLLVVMSRMQHYSLVPIILNK